MVQLTEPMIICCKITSDVVLLEGDGQLWWTAGINRCIEYVLSVCRESDYILTLNNDVLLPKDYLKQKLERAAEYLTAVIGSLCVYSDNPDLIETSGYIMDYEKCVGTRIDKPGSARGARHKGVKKVTHLPGKGVMLPVSLFRQIGLYDEINLPQYHADTDLILRAQQAGYPVYVDYDATLLSNVNVNNMVLPTHEMTLRGIIKTFIGPYSINNLRIRNNFAKKHFPERRIRYLLLTYSKIIGGFIVRYARYGFRHIKG